MCSCYLQELSGIIIFRLQNFQQKSVIFINRYTLTYIDNLESINWHQNIIFAHLLHTLPQYNIMHDLFFLSINLLSYGTFE